jgi:cell wall-associated NlpC family hydrolase
MCPTDDLLGKPFENGGRGPERYDCWGLVCEVFRRYGMELPDYRVSCLDAGLIDATYREERQNWITVERETAVPALVVMRFNQIVFCNHTGVYIGSGRFIHAREKTGVCVENMDHPYWSRAIQGLYIPGWLK